MFKKQHEPCSLCSRKERAEDAFDIGEGQFLCRPCAIRVSRVFDEKEGRLGPAFIPLTMFFSPEEELNE